MFGTFIPTSQPAVITIVTVLITAVVAPTWLSWWNTRQTAKEFRPNGGSSIRDSLNRLETSVAATRQTSLTLASVLGVAYFQTDANGDYRYVSKEWQRMAEMFAEDALGGGWINGIHANHRHQVLREWQDALKFARPVKIHCQMASGAEVHITATPIKSQQGVLEGYVGFCESESSGPQKQDGSVSFQ